MFPIRRKRQLADTIKEFEVEAPLVAAKARPGHFVLVRGDEQGERIPLTIADSDAQGGTITLVMQEIGRGTAKLGAFEEGQAYLDVVGPLGEDRVITGPGKRVCSVAGGLGIAPIYPQAKAHHGAGNEVVSILGARTADLIFWRDRMERVSAETHYATDDGSLGRKAFGAQVLEEMLENGAAFDEVIAIGPTPHMSAVADVCKRYDAPCIVSLNPIMVDGTGMCGGCRVTVGGEVKYACVDGPEFDGSQVDFQELMARQGSYIEAERGAQEGADHACRLDAIETEAPLPLERAPRPQDFEAEAEAFTLRSLRRILRGPGRFDEVAPRLTYDEAQAEANRCLLCGAPQCVQGCPVEVDIPGFIGAVQREDYAAAARSLKSKNSLPAICGRVCPQENQCEAYCTLGKTGRPVSIGALERFVADWEARHGAAEAVRAPSLGQKAAVVGSGPGGLTCAGDLARRGYEVTVFEAFHDTGGVLRYGIPEFRLPKEIVDREVAYVESLGVEIKTNMVIGKTLTVDDLFAQGYEAIFIAVGAGAPTFLGLPGENLVGVFSANEFLTRVNLMQAYRDEYDTPVRVGRRVAVIGAGNVAMDAARTALRLGAETVTIVYRRSEAEIPARADEVAHAKAEGVQFQLLTNPVEILGAEDNRVHGMRCVRMRLGAPDDSGRRRPEPIEGSEFELDCDMVIPALGNRANPLLTSQTEGLELDRRGNIKADDDTGRTSAPGVFAGGDIVIGAATVIEAMGAGKRAAEAMDAYLSERRQAAGVT